MKLNKYTKGSIFCTVLLISYFLPSFSLAQSPGITESKLNWDIIDETYTNNWTWDDSSWEFGPKAQFRIEHLNGTEINQNAEYVNINEEFIVRGFIPEAIFKGKFNRSLGAVEIHWHMDKYNDETNNNPNFFGDALLTADLNLMFYVVHPSIIWDWYYSSSEEIVYEEGWQWEVHSWQQNNTMGEGFEGTLSSSETNEYESLPIRLKMSAEEPNSAQKWEEPESFYTINWNQCEAIYNNFTKTWEVKWNGKFNERVYLGTYRVEMGVYSNRGERINMWGFSSWDFESNDSPEKWIGVGEPTEFDPWWGFGGKWGVKTIDSAGKETNTVGIEELLTFRFNISKSISPGFIFVKLNIPNGYTNTSIVEGWHEEKVTHMGGWVYNESSGTYLYDSTVNLTTTQQVYGFYEVKTWIDCWQQSSQMINRSGWDWSSGSPVWVENLWQEWVSNQFFLIYNENTDEFSLKVGFEYWAENPNDPYMGGARVFNLNNLNISNKIENFFKLYSTNKYLDTEQRTIVEFTGYFTDILLASETQIWYDTGLIDVDGNEHWNSDMTSGQIGVNQPQVNTWIVDNSNVKWDKPFYNMKPGEPFVIRNKLEGSSDFFNSIDGLGFRLNCWESKWTTEIDMWSEIEIYVTYNLKSKETTFEAYNRTNKQVWENSTYQDWVKVEKEGWHWEYDETLGIDIWVNGTYDSWEWCEVTDWHWQEYQFNQEEGEWVKGWLPWRGKETEISSEIEFLVINDVSNYTSSQGTFIDLNITILEGAPEASYNWDVEFLKEAWGYDYDKPWGEYKSLQWINKDIFYYENGGEKNYIEDPKLGNFVVINGSSYIMYEMPYVEIDGETRPLDVSQYTDGDNKIHELIMYYDWDWQTNQEFFYYKDATTDERIIFYEGEKVNIYTVTLNDSSTIDTFQTFMNKPSQYWDDAVYDSVYYFVDIEGTLHYISEYTEWNETGGDIIHSYGDPNNYWLAENTHLRTIENVDQLTLSEEARAWENRVYFVVLDGITRLEISSQGIQWFNGEQYIIATDGTKYTVVTSDWNEQYGTNNKVIIDGVEHYLSDYMEAYRVNYNESEILIPLRYNGYHHNWDNIIRPYYYTIKDNQEYILPYPNANVNERYEMEATVSGLSEGDWVHYGVIPVLYFVNINGELYLMENLTFSNQEPINGDIVIGSEIIKDLEIHKGLVTMINGTPNFNLTVIGESIPYGVHSYNSFKKEGAIEVLSEQILVTQKYDLEHFGIDNFYAENGSFFLTLINGTQINVVVSYYIPIFNLTVKTYNHVTGYDEIWMKDILSINCWEYWNHSKKILLLLNGSFLEIPDNAFIELVDEYQAILEYIPQNTEYYLNLYNETSGMYYSHPINWSEPDFWSVDGQNTINFTFRSDTYFYNNFTFYNEWGGIENFMRNNYMAILEAEIVPGTWKVIKNPNYDWTTKEAYSWKNIYNITIDSENYLVQMENSFIQLYQTIWGHQYGLFLQRQDILQIKDTYNLIFGTPTNNMWGYRMFTTTDEGALDLDGDLSTTDDQYYIYRTYESKDTFSHTRNVLELEIEYNPITSVFGNEMQIHSSMGINNMNWTYEWSEEYTWLKADGTYSTLTSAEMDGIINTVLDENGFGRPGYWELDRMVKNRTWEDVIAEAEKYNWDWVNDNSHEWTWIEFNLDQNYWADFYADSSKQEIKSAYVTNRYEYAGMMLYKDGDNDGFMDIGLDSEITHFFVPSNVDNVSFITPDISNATDHYQETREYWIYDEPITKSVDVYTFIGAANIDWGVKFSTINGTTYPFNNQNFRSMWDWYDGVVDGSDFKGFADKPVEVTIDKLDFMVHFKGNDTVNGLYYNTEFKIDQWVGDWTPHCPGGMNNLENYSLSLTYYVFSGKASMYYEDKYDNGEETQIIDDNNQTINNDNQTMSESFSMVLNDTENTFAKAELGSPYTWSFNTSKNLKVAVFTTPISTFSGAFMSDSEQSCTSFNFDAELYFMSVGFSKWDGYEVYNDPCFQAYVGASSHGEGDFPMLFIVLIAGGITSGVVISIVVIRIRKKRKKIIN